MVEELWPTPTQEIDIAARIGGDLRPPPAGRPWVTMVMVASLDGAIAVDGLSGPLGSDDDHRRFVAMRRHADVIVVGAGTITAEDYRPVSTPVAIVSGSLSVSPAARIFGDPDRNPLIYTTSQAASKRGGDFDGIAEVVDLGDSLDVTLMLADLRHRGFETVALEGGPTLNGSMLTADSVDEVLLSISPVAVSGGAPRLASGPALELDRRFRIDRVLRGGDMLFVRYLRERQSRQIQPTDSTGCG